MTDRLPAISVPSGGFKTNEEEARWLEQTLCLRVREMFMAVGMNVEPKPNGLYELLLISLNAASKRAARNGS